VTTPAAAKPSFRTQFTPHSLNQADPHNADYVHALVGVAMSRLALCTPACAPRIAHDGGVIGQLILGSEVRYVARDLYYGCS
jgi:hypothetical protein